MSNLLDGLVLHQRLDSISTGQILDLSGRGHVGRVLGRPTVVADERFGACLAFAGSGDAVELPPDSIPAGSQLSVSVWLRNAAGAPAGSSVLYATDAHGARVLNMHVPWTDGAVYFDCGNDSAGKYDRIVRHDATAGSFAGWVHWVFTKDAVAGVMQIHRNGELWHSESGRHAAIPASSQVTLGAAASASFYAGRIAQLRVYQRGLTADEIRKLGTADAAALGSFRQSYPIDISLRNDEDEQAVLYVTDGQVGRSMHLHVENASGRVLSLVARAGEIASPTSYHFAARFRPRTLSAAALRALAALDGPLWSAATHTGDDGTVTLYLLSRTGRSVPPGDTLPIEVGELSADGTGGARGTQVEVRYDNLAYPDHAETETVRGRRLVYLAILQHTGQRYLPIHAGFASPNTVLNDGHTANDLTLRLTNIQRNRAIELTPNGALAPSRFILSFDVDEPWALGTTSQVSAIQVVPTVPGWKVEQPHEGASPEWIVTCETDRLGPGASLQLELRGIVSSQAAGPATVYVAYQNVPGYWDGQVTAIIEKSPIRFLGTNGQTVTIGTAGATYPDGALAISASKNHVQLRRESSATSAGKVMFLELYQAPLQNPSLGDVHPSIRFNHGFQYWNRIESRRDGLHLKDGSLDGDGHVDLHFASGHLSGGLTAAGTVEAATVVATGELRAEHGKLSSRLAIGTSSDYPDQRLTVSGASKHLQLRRDSSETAGGKILFLELFQDTSTGPDTYPCIRFHHGNRFWHRIEARGDGLHIKQGNLDNDGHSDLHAATARLGGLRIGNTEIGEYQLQILNKLAAGTLDFELYSVDRDEFVYASDWTDGNSDRRKLFCWTPKGRMNFGVFRLAFTR